jgi:predicted ArsR family transcriptional regulator
MSLKRRIIEVLERGPMPGRAVAEALVEDYPSVASTLSRMDREGFLAVRFSGHLRNAMTGRPIRVYGLK